jgi:hypothetical protein
MRSKQLKAQAIPVREYMARKFLLATALVLGTYLALLPIFHRLAE